jgi:hypothetical protein
MDWRQIFASSYTAHLESEIADLKAERKILLNNLLSENKRLQDEINRIRLSAGQPGTLPETEDVRQPVDPDAPPIFSGTPFQKIQQREMWMESPAGKNWMAKLMMQDKIGDNAKENQNAESSR